MGSQRRLEHQPALADPVGHRIADHPDEGEPGQPERASAAGCRESRSWQAVSRRPGPELRCPSREGSGRTVRGAAGSAATAWPALRCRAAARPDRPGRSAAPRRRPAGHRPAGPAGSSRAGGRRRGRRRRRSARRRRAGRAASEIPLPGDVGGRRVVRRTGQMNMGTGLSWSSGVGASCQPSATGTSKSRPGANRDQKCRMPGNDDLDHGQPDVGPGLVEDQHLHPALLDAAAARRAGRRRGRCRSTTSAAGRRDHRRIGVGQQVRVSSPRSRSRHQRRWSGSDWP